MSFFPDPEVVAALRNKNKSKQQNVRKQLFEPTNTLKPDSPFPFDVTNPLSTQSASKRTNPWIIITAAAGDVQKDVQSGRSTFLPDPDVVAALRKGRKTNEGTFLKPTTATTRSVRPSTAPFFPDPDVVAAVCGRKKKMPVATKKVPIKNSIVAPKPKRRSIETSNVRKNLFQPSKTNFKVSQVVTKPAPKGNRTSFAQQGCNKVTPAKHADESFAMLEEQLRSAKKPTKVNVDLKHIVETFRSAIAEGEKRAKTIEQSLDDLKKHFSEMNRLCETVSAFLEHQDDTKENDSPKRKSERLARKSAESLRRSAMKRNFTNCNSINENIDTPMTKKKKSAMDLYNNFRADCPALCTPRFTQSRKKLSEKVQTQCLMLQDDSG